MGEPLRVGMVGAGAISGAYLDRLTTLADLELVAVADLVPERAKAVLERVPTARAVSLDELLAASDVDVVLNLTVPLVHADVALRAIAAGKAVYGEKPLAGTAADAATMLAAAERADVTLGCAPDTVLGTGVQTARRAVDDGLIGAPIAATATMVTPGHEAWHPDPEFYYQPGGGPLLDMGPYYLTALITMLGPVVRVTGAAGRTRSERVIASGPRSGTVFPVDVDTHVTGVLEHHGGVLSTIVMSFDAVGSRASRIEVHGESGSLVVPDPNHFGGDVAVRRLGDPDWETLPVSAGYRDTGRGCGLADLATATPQRPLRASGALAYHVLDVMERLLESAHTGTRLTVDSTVERPEPVALQELRTR
ncbi:Gfo/Idh/MocA family protein [Pseudonocardia sp. GCM10023141]|uniref:Gfo/Idh/MocA family protein n=1 Tax=Pseudonocardia sp. GCM10023141 TaxID=3252653 RepID=UPI003607896D